MKKKTGILITIMLIMAITVLMGCSSEDEQASLTDAVKLKYSVDTKIAYSADNLDDWVYRNLKKEFSVDKPCYVRLDLTPTTNRFWGVDDEIKGTISFVGVNNCDVESTDGVVKAKKTNDVNRKAFTVVLKPQTEKNAETATYIFKYKPKKACKMVVKVVFDDNVDQTDDKKNAVYFE